MGRSRLERTNDESRAVAMKSNIRKNPKFSFRLTAPRSSVACTVHVLLFQDMSVPGSNQKFGRRRTGEFFSEYGLGLQQAYYYDGL